MTIGCSDLLLLELLLTMLEAVPKSQASCRDSCSTFLMLLVPGLEFERWLNATGPPLAEPDLSQGSSLTRPVETLYSLWTTEPLDAVAAASSVDITKWRTFQTVLFLDRLLDGSPLPHGEYCTCVVGTCTWYRRHSLVCPVHLAP